MLDKIFNGVAIGLVTVLVCGAAFAEVKQGGFKGPGLTVSTVEQAQKMKDDSAIVLEGYITESLGNENYTFKDSTGTITVEIDNNKWGGVEVTPETKVVIEGEVEKEWTSVEIDVDSIRLAQ